MKPLNSVEIRERFLKFFKDNDHKIIAGSSLIPRNDPTLLFINSGMAPLKKYFLGEETPPSKRLANVQPCIRTKDIDDVGDRHHLTLFEMLGSWSIGDYYKQGAVELAYDLLVKHLEFDPKKLYVTVYQGDPSIGLPADEESAKAWEKVGIAKDHIIRLGKDNFWGPAGDTGPCGPCTEVFYDFGEKFGPQWQPGQEFVTTSRYIEIWNAGVFMEFNKLSSAKFEPLPIKSVDTGSGLERMVMAMNNFQTVYETDLLKPFMQTGEKLLAGKNAKIESVRMLADHMRAASFIISEGVAPNNEGQGYIPRRLLRKCVAVMVSHSVKSELLVEYCKTLSKSLGDFYPVLTKNLNKTSEVILKEIREFEPVLQNGLKLVDEKLAKLTTKTLSGSDAFEIVATHGVPLEVLKNHCALKQVKVDEQAYELEFEKHRKVSREGAAKSGVGSGSDGPHVSNKFGAIEAIEKKVGDLPPTLFIGYDKLEVTEEIVKLYDKDGKEIEEANEHSNFYLVTLKSCFYPEGGGQVGDHGMGSNEDSHFDILDTFKVGKIIVHQCHMTAGILHTRDTVQMVVNAPTRLRTRKNHSATHLLNSALRRVLGTHVAQKGSLVDENRLRFDFQHPQALSPEEIVKIEELVNRWIWDNFKADVKEKSYQEAVSSGATTLAGEKYGDKVRTVSFGDSSFELCGGTHVDSTGEIGLFLVTSESSIARGIRRIEGVTGPAALQLVQERGRILKQAAETLATSSDKLLERIAKLKSSPIKVVEANPSSLVSQMQNQEEIKLPFGTALIGQLNVDSKDLKNTAEHLLQKHAFVALVAQDEQTTRILTMASKDTGKKLSAANVIKPILATINGRGGGKENFAQGGGDTSKSAKQILQDLKMNIKI